MKNTNFDQFHYFIKIFLCLQLECQYETKYIIAWVETVSQFWTQYSPPVQIQPTWVDLEKQQECNISTWQNDREMKLLQVS